MNVNSFLLVTCCRFQFSNEISPLLSSIRLRGQTFQRGAGFFHQLTMKAQFFNFKIFMAGKPTPVPRSHTPMPSTKFNINKVKVDYVSTIITNLLQTLEHTVENVPKNDVLNR